MPFLDVLPDPNYKMGIAGNVDAAGTAGPGFAKVNLKSAEPLIHSFVNSGRHERDAAYHHKWIIDIDYNPLTCEEFHPVYTFLLLKKVTMEPFYVSLPQYRDQLTTEKLSDSAILYPIGTNVIEVEDVGTNPITTKPGQIFTIGSSSKVYMTTRVETATDYVYALTGANTERIYYTPDSTSTIPPGTSLFFDDRLIKVVQIGDVSEYDLGANGLFKFSVTLEEVPNG